MINLKHDAGMLHAVPESKTIRVLLVAEKHADFLLVKDLIKESYYYQNYELEWCDNYNRAINAMLKKHYDLYLVDYKLGQHSGLSLLHEAIGSNCAEPIIMLSDHTDMKADEEALRIGATDYLTRNNLDGHSLERSMRYALEHNVALKNLKRNENKFRTIFEKARYPIIISDYAGIIYDANPAALEFFELPLEKLLHENANNFYAPDELKRFAHGMEERGSVCDLEVTLTIPNGSAKHCSLSSFVQISQHGTVYYHSIIHELPLPKTLDHVNGVSSSDQSARNLAFEIQNPLSDMSQAIKELSTSLESNQSESSKTYLDAVKENFERIDKLTKKLFRQTLPANGIHSRS